MSSKSYSLVKLQKREPLSVSFERFTLSGEDLANFPDGCEGGYIKLMFDQQHRPLLNLPDGFPECKKEDKPVVRSFTIVEFNKKPSGAELSFDIAINKDGGVAANWAGQVIPGDEIYIKRPGKSQPLLEGYDAYFVAGDETAIPAINVHLNDLLARQGHLDNVQCVVQCQDEDRQMIDANLDLQIVQPLTEGTGALVQAATTYAWPGAETYVWAACDFEQMRALRRYFRIERGVEKSDMYISSYWKLGETDEGNKRAKKLDSEVDI